MTKKILSLLIVLLLAFNSVPSISYATEPLNNSETYTETDSMDTLDILIATYRVLAATANNEDSMWNWITGLSSIEPLYNLDGEIIALYLTFEPAGYVIINNNLYNPVIMEYSPVDYSMLNDLIQETNSYNRNNVTKDLICYGGALNCFTNNEAKAFIDSIESKVTSNTEILKLADLYTFMKSKNIDEQYAHQEIRNSIEETYNVNPTKASYTIEELKEMFGVIDWGDMPSGTYTYDDLDGCDDVDYGTTGEFDGINGADNHCGATAAFNVVTYYKEYLNEPDLYVNDDRVDTFTALHVEIGNGPVLFPGYNSGLDTYVDDRGYTYHYLAQGGYTSIKNGIDKDQMSTVLMVANLLNWHMVNAVGYREYTSGTKYVRIVDGWENTSRRFILSTNMSGSYITWID